MQVQTGQGPATRTLARGQTWGDALLPDFPGLRGLAVARVEGDLVDLDQPARAGVTVEPVTLTEPDGLRVLRHSTAHVMAQAVQDVFPAAKLGIGPPIENGFYYEFDVPTPFTPEDLAQVEKRMGEILKSGQRFSRRVVTDSAARAELAHEPYKCRLIGSEGGADVMEVGGEALTIYDNLDLKTGEKVWGDLCRGPHVPTTRAIAPNAFKVMRSSAAYWLANQANEQLQRVYGTAWPDKDGLRGYLTFLEEAAKRDHRRLGTELDLFSFPDEIGSGLAVFHPKGGQLRRTMEDYSRRQHEAAGYQFVYTPHITKSQLFEISGHLDWYSDGMYPPMHLDEERDEQGQVRRAGADYYLKPMNCPFHILIYRNRGRSYRELPMRLFEFGSVYRYEKSGVVHGLTRVRGMTQDDAHIFCTREQMQNELKSLLGFVLDLLKDYGLDDFYLELSTRNPDKFVGDIAEWESATAALAEAATSSGLELVDDPGGAAFYGPKISVQAKDAIGRTWQMSTIQLDFQLPRLFDLEYQAPDGTRQQPIMIHRALFGSVERFIGVLTEHYAGAFPPWLAPVQVVGIPITERHVEYLQGVAGQLRAAGIRVDVDASDDRMQKKIRTAQRSKVPFMLLAGDEDVAAGAVSFRYRDGQQRNGVPIAEAIAEISQAIADRVQV
ncbi:MAG: threonine--tRNA ligase [Candidatus Nanopelagicales bacterium]